MFHEACAYLIDVQRAIDDPRWFRHGPRNHPEAERNIARLLEAWRSAGLPVYHVRHDSVEPASPCRPQQPGNEFKPEPAPRAAETIVAKQTTARLLALRSKRSFAKRAVRPW